MKKLFPALLLVFTAGAWISIIYRNFTVPNEYAGIMENAQAAYENQYYLEALTHLKEAEGLQGIETRYSTEELRRDIYYGMQDGDSYETQCLSMIENYPETEENYEKLLQYYWDTENYAKLCQYLPEFSGKWPDNETIAEIEDEFGRLYTYTAVSYYDVQYATDSLVNVQALEYEMYGTDEESKMCTVRVLKNNEGNDVFDMGYAQMAVSMDGSSCFVCDQDGVWTRVDVDNNLLAKNDERKFESIGRLGENNVAPAILDGECHFINHQMKVSDIVWEDAANFSEGVSAVKKNGKWAFVTTDNWDSIAEFPYADIPLNSQRCAAADGIAVAADGKGYYIVDAEEFLPVSENIYEELKAFECSQPTAYREGGKWGFVNHEGDIYIEAAYEDAKPFMNEYAAVKKDGLWGYIDRNGDMVVAPQFEEALNVMSNGVAYVKNDMGYWDFITLARLYYSN